jgi:RNAse (barnase) inhibitor barstar
MKHVRLNAHDWNSEADFYKDILPALKAPEWHGENLDALWDSMTSDEINAVVPPFHIEVVGAELLSTQMRNFLQKVEKLFHDVRGEGLSVGISFDPPL